MEISYTQDSHNPTSIIHSQGLNIRIGTKDIVINGELIVNRGIKYGLIGKNGTGKTTLLHCILKGEIPSEIKPFATHQSLISNNNTVIDEIVSANQEYLDFVKKERHVQEQSKELETKLAILESENADIEDELYEEEERLSNELQDMRDVRISKGYHKIEHLAKKILLGLGFDSDAQKCSVNTFSGGWKMRISLAKVLFMEPLFLLLDEPTNHLDFGATIWLRDYLKNYPNTLILISHNIDFLNNIIENIIELDAGLLTAYRGNYEKYKQQKHQEFAMQVKAFDKNKKKMNAKQRKLAKPHEYQVKLKLDIEASDRKYEIRFENVAFSYNDGHKLVFENLNFQCREGEKTVIVGDNGSGKSTLIKLLMGKLTPQSGSVLIDQRIKFGYLSQNYADLLDMNETPVSLILNRYPQLDMQEIRKTLALANLNPKLHHNVIGTLSGGEQTRVIFSLISLEKPNFVILDEPTNNLDIYTIETLVELLDILECGVVLVSHDTYLINNLSEYRLFICEEKDLLEYEGDIDDYTNDFL